MRAEDLMIGNYVYYNDKIISIAPKAIMEFYYLGDTHSDSKLDRRDYRPIVLSEEILLKCGFIYFKSNNSYQLDTIHGFSFWGRVDDGFNCYCQSEEFGTTIKHLHELQQLYRILTKQELEVKW